jgi:hypothetical protein
MKTNRQSLDDRRIREASLGEHESKKDGEIDTDIERRWEIDGDDPCRPCNEQVVP